MVTQKRKKRVIQDGDVTRGQTRYRTQGGCLGMEYWMVNLTQSLGRRLGLSFLRQLEMKYLKESCLAVCVTAGGLNQYV